MQAMVMLGVPPEQYWSYNIPRFDEEPPSFCYSLGQNYKAVTYFRLDPPSATPTQVKDAIRTQLAAGLPSMFGFTVFSSFPRVGDRKVDISFPQQGDSVLGGHAVVAVGYDDARVIGSERGALLIRNSWGPDWGDGGYGWMPYAYVERGLADDFWSLVRADFVDTDLFK
jgi:C1A family cysteine protease